MDRVGQRREIGQAADVFELLNILEPLLQGDDVDGLLLVVHLHQRLKERLMAKVVKHLARRLEFFNALTHAIMRREQDAPQHPLLRLNGMRRKAVDFRSAGIGGSSAPRLFRIRFGGTAPSFGNS